MSGERKTALVTGASRGIGRAIARQLAADGLRIAVHYNTNSVAAEATLRSLDGEGHVSLPADLADPAAVESLAQQALRVFGGRVDVLVHNAGIYETTPLLATSSLSAWRDGLCRQMQVNFWAGADLAYLLVPAMAQAGWGRVVQISSRAGLRGEAYHAGYGASKAAQINLVRSLAMELGPHGIGCFGVAPGWTDTDMATEALAERGDEICAGIPLGRVASPQDIASLVSFLVSPAADYLSGDVIDVNGASYLR
jgi:3-oxoacyl-[acyl-carrier protein] reductase